MNPAYFWILHIVEIFQNKPKFFFFLDAPYFYKKTEMAPPPEGGRPFQNAPALLSLVPSGLSVLRIYAQRRVVRRYKTELAGVSAARICEILLSAGQTNTTQNSIHSLSHIKLRFILCPPSHPTVTLRFKGALSGYKRGGFLVLLIPKRPFPKSTEVDD